MVLNGITPFLIIDKQTFRDVVPISICFFLFCLPLVDKTREFRNFSLKTGGFSLSEVNSSWTDVKKSPAIFQNPLKLLLLMEATRIDAASVDRCIPKAFLNYLTTYLINTCMHEVGTCTYMYLLPNICDAVDDTHPILHSMILNYHRLCGIVIIRNKNIPAYIIDVCDRFCHENSNRGGRLSSKFA